MILTRLGLLMEESGIGIFDLRSETGVHIDVIRGMLGGNIDDVTELDVFKLEDYFNVTDSEFIINEDIDVSYRLMKFDLNLSDLDNFEFEYVFTINKGELVDHINVKIGHERGLERLTVDLVGVETTGVTDVFKNILTWTFSFILREFTSHFTDFWTEDHLEEIVRSSCKSICKTV